MREVVIVEAVRTPMGRRGGTLSGVHPNDLGAHVLNEVVKRAGIESSMVEDVVFGCVDQVGEQGANVARNVLLTADFPYEVPATTVDRQCGSGQQAIHFAANLIQAGTCDITIGGGVESMSRVPMGVNIMQGPGAPFHMALMEKYPLTPQGISAEEIAEEVGHRAAGGGRVRARELREGEAGARRGPIRPRDRTRRREARGPSGDDQRRMKASATRRSRSWRRCSLPSGRTGSTTRATRSQITDGAAARAADGAREGGRAGPEVAGADRRAGGSGLGSSTDADGADHGDAEGAEESRPRAQGHRPDRDQRGVCFGRSWPGSARSSRT